MTASRRGRLKRITGVFGANGWLSIALVAAAVPVDPPAATAQVNDARRAQDLDAVVRDLTADDWIRIGLSNDVTLYGRFEQRTAAGILLNARSENLDIATARIDSVWLGRQETASGALLGGAIGAALGALLTWVGSELGCDAASGDCDGAPAGTWALMIGGGAAVGVGIGAFIGSQSLKWKLAFPRSEHRSK